MQRKYSRLQGQRVPHQSGPLWWLVSTVLLASLLSACTPSQIDREPSKVQRDTLSRYQNGSAKEVVVQRADSILERRTYRRTGTLFKIATEDSVRSYFDLHDPDSAAVLKDYLQGRWRNLSADTTREEESAFYIFKPTELTFENPSRVPLESIDVSYEKNRILTTENGMSVEADIASFDTVRVTGYTLVRSPPSDSI